MYNFSWWARIRRTLYKASLIKWLLSNKNLVLPIKHTQVHVLILLTLCLHYALEEAAWPFCLIQAHFANTNKMLCLVECWCKKCNALMEPFLNGVSLNSPHRLVVYCCSLLYKLAQPLRIFCFTRSFSASSPGSSLLPAEQSLYHSQKTKTVALSPFVFVSIAVPVQFDLSSSAASVLRLQWFPIIAQYTFRDPCSIYTHTPL